MNPFVEVGLTFIGLGAFAAAILRRGKPRHRRPRRRWYPPVVGSTIGDREPTVAVWRKGPKLELIAGGRR